MVANLCTTQFLPSERNKIWQWWWTPRGFYCFLSCRGHGWKIVIFFKISLAVPSVGQAGQLSKYGIMWGRPNGRPGWMLTNFHNKHLKEVAVATLVPINLSCCIVGAETSCGDQRPPLGPGVPSRCGRVTGGWPGRDMSHNTCNTDPGHMRWHVNPRIISLYMLRPGVGGERGGVGVSGQGVEGLEDKRLQEGGASKRVRKGLTVELEDGRGWRRL